jgi:predicted O-methyltransferase YrrM
VAAPPDEAPFPAIVRDAHEAAVAAAFEHSCSHPTGRLLRVLAARYTTGILLEVGTGLGVGAAWIASGMGSGCRLHTFETDPDRAALAAEVLAPMTNVEVHLGDWRTAVLGGPARLAFVDARSGKWEDQQNVVDRVEVGGTIVLDDFTPLEELTWEDDPVRDWWFGHPKLLTTEILVGKAEAVLLAVKVTATSNR